MSTSTDIKRDSAAASVAQSTVQPIIRRINDRFISIQTGSASEVRFSPIRPGLGLFDAGFPAPSVKPANPPAAQSAPPPSKADATPAVPTTKPTPAKADAAPAVTITKPVPPVTVDVAKPDSTSSVSTNAPASPASKPAAQPAASTPSKADAAPAVAITKPVPAVTVDVAKPDSTSSVSTNVPASPASKPAAQPAASTPSKADTAPTVAITKPAPTVTVDIAKPDSTSTAAKDSFGVAGEVDYRYDEARLVKLLKGGHVVTLCADAAVFRDMSGYLAGKRVGFHAVAVSGVACSAKTGEVLGFYITDSGPGRYSEMNRFLSVGDLRNMDAHESALIYSVDPAKLLHRDSSATGNELDNILVGNQDNNLLTGAKGNDTLTGQAGNDTYVFGKGDGRDLVVDQDATAGNIDTIKFSDARQTNLWFSQVGKDLQIDVLGSTDQVTVKDWYAGADNRVERIKTADGKTLYDSDVDKLVQAMASFDPPAATQTSWTDGQTSKGKVLLTVTH
ncbi:calcium-binding protein [Herbaspirillum seropedicae]|uniref:calcium-binding protein n=1 Tax=Herbaspirillum seropedicae TaxID=964 RepID=UPI0031CF6627